MVTSGYAEYLKAERLINQGLIRRDLSIEREDKPPRDPAMKMAAMNAFLSDCGRPQRGIPAVHIAGTSGKGSVAAATAGILRAAGLKVGLHVSPYLQSATEKIWIDGRFISAEAFSDIVDWVMPIAKRYLSPSTPASIHGMASVVVALEAFRRAEVDVMVFEAGCGGRFDLSNVLDSIVCVVTNVGLDHLNSLGPTIDRIAWHKAGIAKPGIPLITGATDPALPIIRKEAATVGAPVVIVERQGRSPLVHNADIAAAAARAAGITLGTPVSDADVVSGSGAVRMAGRVEVMPCDTPRVVLDGAHNPEKLKVAIDAALAASPRMGPRVCLFGAIGAKAGPDLAAPLFGRFDHIVATEPSVYAKRANPAAHTAALFDDAECALTVIPDPVEGFHQAKRLCGDGGTLVVTGSFYLLAPIRELFYPKQEVVCQRTSFPLPNFEK